MHQSFRSSKTILQGNVTEEMMVTLQGKYGLDFRTFIEHTGQTHKHQTFAKIYQQVLMLVLT